MTACVLLTGITGYIGQHCAAERAGRDQQRNAATRRELAPRLAVTGFRHHRRRDRSRGRACTNRQPHR